jgi:type III restriction enzyme
MKIQLEELEYQKQAIASVTGVFEGQPKNTFENSVFFGVKSNTLSITPDQTAENKRRIITNNNIDEETAQLTDDNDYCIEMETGTGKTIVYIRTLYELHKQYGFTKFIILVPSIAIKEGVIKSFQMFEPQLRDLYGFRIPYFEYNSKRLTQIKHFVDDTQPQVMVMTVQSFTSDDRIINQEGRDDAIMGMSYVQAIGKTQPVIVMDEPQEGMDTENSIARIKEFNPICKLRYSATHKVVKNLLYRLTPYQAYQQGMVKKIEVLSVAEKNDEATLKLEVKEVQTKAGQNPKVKLNAWFAQKGGFRQKETPWLNVGADLAQVTGNNTYIDYRIERISKGLRDRTFKVRFTNGVELVERERSTNLEDLFQKQLYWLIDSHFERKRELTEQGIKCLSLIFIDRVNNYVAEDGIIKRLFHEQYSRVYKERFGEEPTHAQIVACQGYYFAQTGKGEYTDDEGSMQKNREIYERILRDKEALLSFDDPIEFIFSHSALGVGWYNPNVFNIATLNQSFSEIKKRQEIGRGLRICVNQDGHRVYDLPTIEEGEEINRLTVVPNETYETFVSQYQEEIREVYGTTSAGSNLREKRKDPTIIRINDKKFDTDEFRDFWKKLARKTDYVIAFDEKTLIERAIEELSKITVPEYEVEVVLTRIKGIYQDSVDDEEIGRETERLKATFSPLDLVEELSESSSLSYPTTLKIVQGLKNFSQVVKNPHRFVKEATVIIRRIELEQMLRGLSYHPTGESISLSEFEETIKTWLPTRDTPNRGIYDKVICDSNSKPEREFAGEADTDPEVVCFLKLPNFYEIPTPIGKYRPDFGLVVRRKRLKSTDEFDYYFVVETKSTGDLGDMKALTEGERYKIECAQKHFEALGIDAKIEYQIYHAPVQNYQRDFKSKIKA